MDNNISFHGARIVFAHVCLTEGTGGHDWSYELADAKRPWEYSMNVVAAVALPEEHVRVSPIFRVIIPDLPNTKENRNKITNAIDQAVVQVEGLLLNDVRVTDDFILDARPYFMEEIRNA